MTVSLAFAPEVVMAIAGVRDARRLRGRPTRGVAGLRGMAIPVLESALDRSLQLASSMDARGYGRRVAVPDSAPAGWAVPRPPAGCSSCWWGVRRCSTPGSLPAGGVPFVAAGAVLVGVGMAVGGRRTNRTRYRPDVWRTAEWLVVASGAVALAGLIAAGILDLPGLQFSVTPLHPPQLPLLAVLGVLVGSVPAVAAPAPVALAVPRRPHRTAEMPAVAVQPVEGSRA